jgi:cytochrome c oxidase subunit 5b
MLILWLEVKTEEDLLPPGGAPGTVPTDIEQATGLERLEILGKMQGIDIFDMKPLDASRKGMVTAKNPGHWGLEYQPRSMKMREEKRASGSGRIFATGIKANSILVLGTLDNPIIVRSFGDEQYAGCTGYPADSHVTIWLTVSSPRVRNSTPLYSPRPLLSPRVQSITCRMLIALALLDIPRPAGRTVPRVW